MKKTGQFILYLMIGGILCFTACTEDPHVVLPGNGMEAYINFFNSSEAISSGSLYTNNMIYINDSIQQAPFYRFPQFPDYPNPYREYPRFASGTDRGPNGQVFVPPGANYHNIFWMPVASGSYKFIFTSVNKVYLKDTTVVLPPKSLITQYLVESPEADDAYRIVTVPVEQKGMAGKVRIQVVNLATDLGRIDIYRSAKDGSLIPSDLPANLDFGGYSPYAEVDTTGSAATNNLIFLKVRRSGNTDVLLTAAVPAASGSSFTIMVQGFSRQAVRRIKSGNSAYTTVTVTPNLRISIRRIL